MMRSAPVLNMVLKKRALKGKEDPDRIDERCGIAGRARPDGALIWIHAASVGEAQSALVLVDQLLQHAPSIHILVTTGTQTSAKRMKDSLPDRAIHQFMPLDHPDWTNRFLDHWQPDCVFWMESELWPNILNSIKARGIPAGLINARLSPRSYRRWKLIKGSISDLLNTFDIILTQSESDADNFKALGAKNVMSRGNLKYSAAPLPFDDGDFKKLQAAIGLRPVIVYASTHDGEEKIAAELHDLLVHTSPDLLTVIIPRHPQRGTQVADGIKAMGLNALLRSENKALPDTDTQIYIADTLGEMGLFYRVARIAYVGRSLSNDGGGGHNPLEPALLNCAVIHGKNIQNLRDIYDEMQSVNACIMAEDKDALTQKLAALLGDDEMVDGYIKRAREFSNTKVHVIDNVMNELKPILEDADI